ncbi:MAG: hypothetical protein QM765_28390 [Myxococcales bacterium]
MAERSRASVSTNAVSASARSTSWAVREAKKSSTDSASSRSGTGRRKRATRMPRHRWCESLSGTPT